MNCEKFKHKCDPKKKMENRNHLHVNIQRLSLLRRFVITFTYQELVFVCWEYPVCIHYVLK